MEERLGEGAAGVMYRAVHVGLERSFAIKFLIAPGPPSSAALKRFRRVAIALGRLRHPNIVDFTDFGVDEATGGVPYIVTELLEGVSLADICRQQGPQALVQALPLLGQIAAAVDAAHEAGIFHQDLNPGNVFVVSKGPAPPMVKVLDFGLRELLAGPHMKQASRISDIYSFGALAYEILGGQMPLRGTLEGALAGHGESESLPPLPVPPRARDVLLSTLREDPACRPDTAGDVIRELAEGGSRPKDSVGGTPS